MGEKAKRFMKMTAAANHNFAAVHPAAAAHQKLAAWDSKDLFNRINNALIKSGKKEIIW